MYMYIVVKCDTSEHALGYECITLMTTNIDEAWDEMRRLDAMEDTVGIIETMECSIGVKATDFGKVR